MKFFIEQFEPFLYLCITILMAVSLFGCSSVKRTTIFYKTEKGQLVNLEGENCSQSGLILDESHGILVEYFNNCDVTIKRPLKPHEVKQWPGLDKRRLR